MTLDVPAGLQNLEAERSVLGAVLLSNDALEAVEDEGLRSSDFFRHQYGRVFSAMESLATNGQAIDVLTLAEELRGRGELDDVGGLAAIDLLAASVPAVGSVRQYAHMVREKAQWRVRRAAASRALAECETENKDGFIAALAAADAADPQAQESRIHPIDHFTEWYNKQKVAGLPTPFAKVTNGLGGGLVPGDVTAISGWPSFGKTVLAAQFLTTVRAVESEARLHLYLSEMDPGVVTARFLAGLTGVPWGSIFKRSLDAKQWSKVFEARDKVPCEYTMIDGWTVDQITRHMRRNRWDLCVVDSASRIPHRDTRELEYVSGSLADAARGTDCHLIEVLQLNLERCKTPERPPPIGRDLLGGGMWFRDARNVLFVHRSQEKMDRGRYEVLPEGDLSADKATHGVPSEAYVQLVFVPSMMRFVEQAQTPLDEPSGNGRARATTPPTPSAQDGYAKF